MKLAAAVLPALLFAFPAKAEDLVGEVYLTGSDLHIETHIDVAKNRQGPRLCPGEIDDRLHHLGELRVKVSGLWQWLKGGVKDCFAPSSFKITHMAGGREAVVGRLSAVDATYLVTSSDGVVVPLADLPQHLREMMGEQVILDLKPMANPAVKGENKVVVSYRRFP